MRYTHVFFDLDGTLLDTGPGVKHAFQYALAKMGLPVLPEAELDFALGPPLYWSFHEKLGLGEEDAVRATALYREYYSDKGLWECAPFEGIDALLRALQAAGVRLGVVTGKPEKYARPLMEHFGWAGLFDCIVGTEPSDKNASKKALLERAFADCGIGGDRAGVLMVGDRCFDIDGAHDTGIDSMGVLFGFGSRDELEGCRATHLAADAAEMRALLLD